MTYEKTIIDACQRYFIPKEYQSILLNKRSLQRERERISEDNVIAFASAYYNIDFTSPESLRFWVLHNIWDDEELSKRIRKKRTYESKINCAIDSFIDKYIQSFKDIVLKDAVFAEQFEDIVYRAYRNYNPISMRSGKPISVYMGSQHYKDFETKALFIESLGLVKNSSIYKKLNKCIKTEYPFYGYMVKEKQ